MPRLGFPVRVRILLPHMSYETRFPDWEDKVKSASLVSASATAAAALLGIKFDTYRKYATKYGCFHTNQSGKNTNKPSSVKIPLEDILHGKHPQYQSNKLRLRLLEEGYFEPKCYSCGLFTWLDKPIPLELEHIDGNSGNHLISNLTLLCPNCHSFTPTYRGKNIK